MDKLEMFVRSLDEEWVDEVLMRKFIESLTDAVENNPGLLWHPQVWRESDRIVIHIEARA